MIWATTTPSGNANTCAEDAGVTGWKLHLITPGSSTGYSFALRSEVDKSKALCGLVPRYGWGLDMFIDEPCRRCVAKAKKLGIELPDIT